MRNIWFVALAMWALMMHGGQAYATPPVVHNCINMGNMLEAPNEGEWGTVVEERYFGMIAEVGFDTVRIPIHWSGHADATAPYTIDPVFLARVDEVIEWALDANLQVIVNVHLYYEMMETPLTEWDRYSSIWDQLATHYADYPPSLMFELLSEPYNELDVLLWNEIANDTIQLIRQSNPERTLIVGGVEWNGLNALWGLNLPADQNVMATFHYYLPFEFTHQGAEWVGNMDGYLGTTWGTEPEVANIQADFREAAAWSQSTGYPLVLTEFGAYSKADLPSRLAWTTTVRETAHAMGLGSCYWEFNAGFGIYDNATQSFNELLTALIP